MNFLRKLLIPSSLVLLITACGSDSNGTNTNTETDEGQSDNTTQTPQLNEDIISTWQSSCENNMKTTVVFSRDNADYNFSYEMAKYDGYDCIDAPTSQERFSGPLTYVELPSSSGQVERLLQFNAIQPQSVIRDQTQGLNIENAVKVVCDVADYVGNQVILEIMKTVIEAALTIEEDLSAVNDKALDDIVNKLLILIPDILFFDDIIKFILEQLATGIHEFVKAILSVFKFIAVSGGDLAKIIATLSVNTVHNICNGDLGELLFERRVMSAVSVSDDSLYLSKDFQICKADVSATILNKWSHCTTDLVLNFENPLTRVEQ